MKQEIKNSIIIAIGVLFVIAVTYFGVAMFLTGEIGNNKDDSQTVLADSGISLSYDNVIIAGNTFSQKENNYMVMFFSEKNSSETLKNSLSLYDSAEKSLKLYKVNLDEAINSFVKSEENNTNATNSKELKIKQNTLITINNGIITSYVEDEAEILNNLK